jgi:hypothetical protein
MKFVKKYNAVYSCIVGYTELYGDRKGIYRDIRGITQYITIGKINIISGFEPRTLCMMNGSSYHCTTSVDAEETL